MLQFCTLFYSNYLSRGLAMLHSLIRQNNQAKIWVLAMDRPCFQFMQTLALPNTKIIFVEDIETDALKAIKPLRNIGEYSWTCKPFFIKYLLETYKLEELTYIEADAFFFNDPVLLFPPREVYSTIITEHRYTPRYDQTSLSGRFCAQWITTRNDADGRAALSWWNNACLDWCYAYPEEGKYADQKYLETLPTEFNNVHVMKHEGGGLAPWNIQQYDVYEKEGLLQVKNRKSKESMPLVFFHYHGFKFTAFDRVMLSGYLLSKDHIRLIYKPYLISLMEMQSLIKQINPEIKTHDINALNKPTVKLTKSDDMRKIVAELRQKGMAQLINRSFTSMRKRISSGLHNKKVHRDYQIRDILAL